MKPHAPSQHHNVSPRQTEIDKLKDSLLKSPALVPRVKEETQVPVPRLTVQNQAPIQRVTFQEPISSQITTDDPPDLIEEDNTIPDLSSESQNSTPHKHKHNLRERKNLLNKIIHATTTPALISNQATKSINIPSATDDMPVDDHHLPIIDEHPANTLHR